MNINYHSLIYSSTLAYPARVSTVVNVAGSFMEDSFFTASLKSLKFESVNARVLEELILKSAEEDGETSAVVFTGGEPCLQANALIPLCCKLQAAGFKVKIDTTGFYPEELKALLPVVNYVSFEVKTKLDETHYSRVLEPVAFSTFYGRVIRSLVFLQNAKVMREVKTPVIGGFNNAKSIVESIASEITNFADLYVLEQWTASNCEVAKNAGFYPPSRQELIELAAAARNIFPKVSIRTFCSQDQEITKKQ